MKSKMWILMEGFHEINDKMDALHDRLDSLLEAKKITGGARYYIYNLYRWHSFDAISDISRRACNSKSGFRKYVQVHVRQDWINILWDSHMKNYNDTLTFVEEQEAATFENSQYQTLAREGKLH